MGMWDSIKKTTSKITKSIMPNPTEVGEIVAAEQKKPVPKPKPKSTNPKNTAGTVKVKPKKK